jgi:hypothetical protein
MLALRLALMPGVVDLAQLLKSVEPGSAPRPIAPQQAPRPAPAPAVTRKKPVVVVSHDQKPPTTAEQSPITASPEPPATPSTAKTPEEAWDELLAGLDDPMLKSLFAGQAELRSFKDGEAEILFSNNFFCKQFKHKLDSNTGFRDLVRRAFNNAVIRTHVGGETTGSAAKPAFVAEKENDTDLARALKNEALEHKLVRALLEEFEGSSVLEINVLAKSELKRHTPPHD